MNKNMLNNKNTCFYSLPPFRQENYPSDACGFAISNKPDNGIAGTSLRAVLERRNVAVRYRSERAANLYGNCVDPVHRRQMRTVRKTRNRRSSRRYYYYFVRHRKIMIVPRHVEDSVEQRSSCRFEFRELFSSLADESKYCTFLYG